MARIQQPIAEERRTISRSCRVVAARSNLLAPKRAETGDPMPTPSALLSRRAVLVIDI